MQDVQLTYCVVFLFFVFLCFVHSMLFCFSGLSIFDCPIGFSLMFIQWQPIHHDGRFDLLEQQK